MEAPEGGSLPGGPLGSPEALLHPLQGRRLWRRGLHPSLTSSLLSSTAIRLVGPGASVSHQLCTPLLLSASLSSRAVTWNQPPPPGTDCARTCLSFPRDGWGWVRRCWGQLGWLLSGLGS